MNLCPFPQLQLTADAQIGAGPSLLADSALAYGFHKRQRAAVENGELQVVQLDDGIVDAATDQGGEQMLGGGNEHALFHQTGGVADPGHVPAHRFQFKAVEVGATKDHARSRRRRQDPQLDRSTAMQPYATALDGRANCLFVYQTESAVCCLMMNLSFPARVRLWLISHSTWSRASGIRNENHDIYLIINRLRRLLPWRAGN